MILSEEQRQAVREWVAQGASLADVQRNLKSDFDIALTYMDVRLLVLDIGAALQDKPEPKPPQPPPAERADAEADEMAGAPPEEDGGGMSVSLALDALMVPGAMVSGTVVFSDGEKARWLIDPYGRFGFEPETPGYRPSQEDMQVFQMKLRAELQRKGYA